MKYQWWLKFAVSSLYSFVFLLIFGIFLCVQCTHTGSLVRFRLAGRLYVVSENKNESELRGSFVCCFFFTNLRKPSCVFHVRSKEEQETTTTTEIPNNNCNKMS